MAKQRITRKFLLYLFFSGFAALVNFASRFLYETIPGVNFEIAVALAYLTGMIVNFAFSKWITFQAASSGRFRREAVKFFLIASLGLIVTVAISAGALRFFAYAAARWSQVVPSNFDDDIRAATAHLIGMGAGLVMNFFGHEMLSFRETGIYDRLKGILIRDNDDE
ncbi:MAG: GtrA family protein [Leptospiraceae bacterium]|nr:GtrA family protein [Leptospiraceae bacterium]